MMLEVRELHAFYGKSHILQGVNLSVGEGEIVSLLGRNGVGRSTTCKAIMGLVEPVGEVLYRGKNLAGMRTNLVAKAGIGYVPEDRQIFPTLTVRQNLMLGLKRAGRFGRWNFDDVFKLFPNLAERQNNPAGVLSGGEQQVLTMCRTLMGDPDLILIDEPTEAPAPMLVEQVGYLLEEIARFSRHVDPAGGTEAHHRDANFAAALSLMGHGRIVFEGTPADVKDPMPMSAGSGWRSDPSLAASRDAGQARTSMSAQAPVRALTDNAADTVRGILLVAVSYLILTIGDTAAKLAIIACGVAWAMTWRGTFGAVAVTSFTGGTQGHQSGLARFRPVRWKTVALRSGLSSFTTIAWYLSWQHMQLADTYALGFTAPLIMTLLAVPMLGERIRWRRMLSTLVGFAGVLVMVRPGGIPFSPAMLLLMRWGSSSWRSRAFWPGICRAPRHRNVRRSG